MEVDKPLRLGDHARPRESARPHGDMADVLGAQGPWEPAQYTDGVTGAGTEWE
ncbi:MULTISPECIES: hypothetical protein [unclassified Streptomyces]|uniref:hypothetical protein n=1 Tax=unclassified Streptomyces TaxID=2593676 RepID=UPI00339DB284|nr:hypothetical protein OG199_39030 [Streptomyces sp. NBC_01176]